MEDTLRHGIFPALLGLLVITTSCAWYRDLERSMVEEDERKLKQRASRSVPREQYDQLLIKYEELSKKYEQLKEGEVTQRPQDTETVDVFADANVSRPVDESSITGDVESQLSLFRRAVALKASNPGEATKIFQELEVHGIPPVRARAKLELGELLLGKHQYDLALQVFEDIIAREAHSGVVLNALRMAVICSDKLGIVNKKDQYSSMLKDVFEVN